MRRILIMLAAISAAGTVVSPVASAAPLPSPGHFVPRVTNTWFPLKPGTVYVYLGVKDGIAARDVVTVTHATKTIAGIRATVVHDNLYEHGRVAERTTDWYAQDRAGNVWYLGEDTATLNARGKVTSTEGTWRAGVRGARAGIYMPGHPRVGQAGRQEFYAGHAEDYFQVLSLNSRVRSPAVTSSHALLTKETTPLEPGVVDHKLYVRGIGTVREETVKGGSERLVLQSIRVERRI